VSFALDLMLRVSWQVRFALSFDQPQHCLPGLEATFLVMDRFSWCSPKPQ
jgi:hypothetical protein